MKFINSIFKISVFVLILLSLSTYSHSKILDFSKEAKNISNYFSGAVAFNNFDYDTSKKHLDKFIKSEKSNKKSSSFFLQSLINLQKFNEAYSYSKSLENKKLQNFESGLILGLFEFKNKNYNKAKLYFQELEPNIENQLIFEPLKISLINWSEIMISNKIEDIDLIKSMSKNFGSFKSIQEIFAYCYFDNAEVDQRFTEVIKDESGKFYRYNFFFANYLIKKNRKKEADSIIDLTIKKYPRNLLINQLKENLKKNNKNKNKFSCQKPEDILAEIFYAFANALSVQKRYELSNLYINFSKYLNPNFKSYNALLAENLLMLNKYEKSKNIFKELFEIGSFYKWHASKEISLIIEELESSKKSLEYLTNVYENMNKNFYRTFDFANFVRGHDKFSDAIKLYTEILSEIDKDDNMYPIVLDRRGTAYERNGNWELAEKDLLLSLEIEPNQAYTLNYLAYTWIEQGKKTSEALSMLRKANNLKKNDGYITDSLGWAQYKLKNFSEAKFHLERAIQMMPDDPIVNDHFADCLWMINKKIQARYYWEYVLTLEDTEDELREKIKNKLLFGLEKI